MGLMGTGINFGSFTNEVAVSVPPELVGVTTENVTNPDRLSDGETANQFLYADIENSPAGTITWEYTGAIELDHVNVWQTPQGLFGGYFTVHGSDTGSFGGEEDLLLNSEDLTWGAGLNEKDFTASGSYTYYRLTSTSYQNWYAIEITLTKN